MINPDGLYDALHTFIIIALYAFIGIVIWTLWKDIKSRRRIISLNTVQAGELVKLSNEEAFPLMPVTSLGRATTNVIAITDPAISLEHAMITRREGTWWLEDLQSRNGTLLNSQIIDAPAVITSGDIITLGNSQYKVLIRPASS